MVVVHKQRWWCRSVGTESQEWLKEVIGGGSVTVNLNPEGKPEERFYPWLILVEMILSSIEEMVVFLLWGGERGREGEGDEGWGFKVWTIPGTSIPVPRATYATQPVHHLSSYFSNPLVCSLNIQWHSPVQLFQVIQRTILFLLQFIWSSVLSGYFRTTFVVDWHLQPLLLLCLSFIGSSMFITVDKLSNEVISNTLIKIYGCRFLIPSIFLLLFLQQYFTM